MSTNASTERRCASSLYCPVAAGSDPSASACVHDGAVDGDADDDDDAADYDVMLSITAAAHPLAGRR